MWENTKSSRKFDLDMLGISTRDESFAKLWIWQIWDNANNQYLQHTFTSEKMSFRVEKIFMLLPQSSKHALEKSLCNTGTWKTFEGGTWTLGVEFTGMK